MLYAIGGTLRAMAAVLRAWAHPAETARLARLRRQRATWRRVTAGDDLPPKVRAYLETLS